MARSFEHGRRSGGVAHRKRKRLVRARLAHDIVPRDDIHSFFRGEVVNAEYKMDTTHQRAT